MNNMNAYFVAQNILTSLGHTTEENVNQILNNKTGIRISNHEDWTVEPTPLSEVDREVVEKQVEGDYTIFEKFLIFAIRSSLEQQPLFDIQSEDTIIIISTTKGNIELLNPEKAKQYDKDRIHLWRSAEIIQTYFQAKHTPLVISNACISGAHALVTAMRKLKSGAYKHAVVVGADVLSRFVVSGFGSFKSLDAGACKPFDKNRTGLSLGEGAACILMSTDASIADASQIVFASGATANDANHISGPSRTAEGQYLAMQKANVENETIDFISAHGTATPYNDDMESIAIARHHLNEVPVNSFKGYFGHTLGAAGLIESALSIWAIKENQLFKTLGFEEAGTVEPINVQTEHQKQNIKTVLKLSSGFGGSNAALVIKTVKS